MAYSRKEKVERVPVRRDQHEILLFLVSWQFEYELTKGGEEEKEKKKNSNVSNDLRTVTR